MTRAAAGLKPSDRGFKYLNYQQCSSKLAAAKVLCDGGGGRGVSAAGGESSGTGSSTLYLDLTRFA